jgi:hypothetical protein
VHHGKIKVFMSALGHKQTLADVRTVSALALKVDIAERD